MRTTRWFAALAVLVLAAPAAAQDEMPAISDDEQPAVQTPAPRTPGTATPRTPSEISPSEGTTVVGEKEAPIGLYIMPWRQSQAESGLDRPARLLDEQLMPLDPEVFRRQVEYNRALTDHLEKSGRATP